MINPFKETNWHPSARELRAFGRSLLIGFPILACVLLVLGLWSTGRWLGWPVWLGNMGFAVGLLALLAPGAARPFYLLWYGVACCLGIVASNAVLALTFYVVLTPVGLLRRVFGRDPMERRWQPEAKSYWKTVEPPGDARRYFSQY